MGELCYHCFQEKANSGICEHCGFDPSQQEGKYPLALPYGTILNGRYITGRVLGQGGFGVTYLAQDYQTKERVAIKEYFPSDLSTRTGSYRVTPYSGQREQDFEFGKKRFLDEAKTLAEFNDDPHIVSVYRYFDEESTQTVYFVMEYVDGVSLENYVKSKGGRISPEEANQILVPLMRSLGEVHKKGIVHRDIAPDNILISGDGSVKLIDFGAARSSTGNKSMSMDVVVKHGFAPMEQYSRHGRVGPYTDIYSMGATWYYAITGRIPPESIDRSEEDGLILPGILGVRLPEKQLNALLKALAVRAEDRYQSMEEFASELEFESESVVGTTRENLVTRAFDYLEQGNWEKADSYLNTAMDFEPQNPMIYIGRLMAQHRVAKQEDLGSAEPFDQDPLYAEAIQYADPDLKLQLEAWAHEARLKVEREQVGKLAQEGMAAVKSGKWDTAVQKFSQTLQIEPQHAQAHLGMLMAENHVKKIEQLARIKDIEKNIHYAAAVSGDPELQKRLKFKSDGGKGKPWKWFLAVAGLAAAGLIVVFVLQKPTPVEQQSPVAPSLVLPVQAVPETSSSTALPTITISPADASKIYDGKELQASDYTVEGELNGFTVQDVVFEGSLTNPGTGEARIASFSLIDPEGKRVEDSAVQNSGTVKTASGTLTVEKRELTVTAVTAEVTTEGEAIAAGDITDNGYTNGYKAEGLVDGQHLEGSFVFGSGSRSFGTRITVSNLHVKDESGNEVTDCYNVKPVSGRVTITIAPLSLKVSEDCSLLNIIFRPDKTYDSVRFAIWSQEGDQDDLRWRDASINDSGAWEYTENLIGHRSAGIYYVHAYGNAQSGQEFAANSEIEVAKAVVPENHIEAERLENDTARIALISKNGYSRVVFAFWSDEDGQDDLAWYEAEKDNNGVWSSSVILADHPGSNYNIHCYVAKDGTETEELIDNITRYWA